MAAHGQWEKGVVVSVSFINDKNPAPHGRGFAILAAMKLLCLVAAFLLSCTAFAQQAPLKGANTIIVTLPDSSVTAWQKVGKAFTQQGFAIKASDSQLLTLTTEPLPVGEGGQLTASAAVEGKQVVLRGTVAVPAISRSTAPLEYRGSKGDTRMRAWSALEKVVTALGGSVTYARR